MYRPALESAEKEEKLLPPILEAYPASITGVTALNCGNLKKAIKYGLSKTIRTPNMTIRIEGIEDNHIVVVNM